VAHGDAREGKWRGNWRMEWVASILTPPPNVVYRALLKLMRTLRLRAVDWTDAHTDLNGLVRFGERWNLVSVCVCHHVPHELYHRIPISSKEPLTQWHSITSKKTGILIRICVSSQLIIQNTVCGNTGSQGCDPSWTILPPTVLKTALNMSKSAMKHQVI